MIYTVYGKPGCGYCQMAMSLLRQKQRVDTSIQIDYKELGEDYTKKQLLKLIPGVRTLPQIFADDKYIGGYEQLKEYLI